MKQMKIVDPVKLASIWMMSILVAIILTRLVMNLSYEPTKYVVITQEQYNEIYGVEEE